MSRRCCVLGVCVALVLLAPGPTWAYFPPVTIVNQGTPPDPFQVPGLGGLGEPEAPEPDKSPTVATPEPATLVSALAGLVVAAGYGWRRRNAKS